IGALIAQRREDGWAVSAIGAPHVGPRTEKQLISAFVDKIAALSPQLVTFNGNGFDLPVLRYRAMINRVPAPENEAIDPGWTWAEDEDVRATLRPVVADKAETAQFLASRGLALTPEARARFLMHRKPLARVFTARGTHRGFVRLAQRRASLGIEP